MYGVANASTKNESLKINAGIDKWTITGSGTLNVSSPADITVTTDEIDIDLPDQAGDWANPAGLGAGIDLGATYKLLDELTLSASITDLGFIRWRGKPNNISYKINYQFDGFFDDNTDMDGDDWLEDALDTILTAIKDNLEYELDGTNPFTTSTSPKLNIGAEYSLWDYKLNFGLLSRTMLHKSRLYEELTVSVTTRPVNWFNFGLSYSLVNGKFSTLGAGMGLRSGIINWHFSADYVPLTYASLPLDNSSFKVPIPYRSKGFNFAMGINLVFRSKNDRDRDGVPDKYDLCPDTPRRVKVDANGCPMDTDGDGVPDYLDLCPDTPREAYGYVDENGCLLDTDGDGVPDYLDRCPDTPEAARGMIDEFGCPIDSDGDGVPDYMDECPDTPAEAYGYVDEFGCPLDTDGDGIPDYMDDCPKIPGVAENNGCPEIKKEVRSLFQQALQGIQFETGKAVIKSSSHTILNQIAKVMEENPAYTLEIRGHTDNVGKEETNQKLSEDRAASVREYLIKKGVAPERMKSVGFGETLPVATNSTAAGRAQNRRVEFLVSFEEVKFE